MEACTSRRETFDISSLPQELEGILRTPDSRLQTPCKMPEWVNQHLLPPAGDQKLYKRVPCSRGLARTRYVRIDATITTAYYYYYCTIVPTKHQAHQMILRHLYSFARAAITRSVAAGTYSSCRPLIRRQKPPEGGRYPPSHAATLGRRVQQSPVESPRQGVVPT